MDISELEVQLHRDFATKEEVERAQRNAAAALRDVQQSQTVMVGQIETLARSQDKQELLLQHLDESLGKIETVLLRILWALLTPLIAGIGYAGYQVLTSGILP